MLLNVLLDLAAGNAEKEYCFGLRLYTLVSLAAASIIVLYLRPQYSLLRFPLARSRQVKYSRLNNIRRRFHPTEHDSNPSRRLQFHEEHPNP